MQTRLFQKLGGWAVDPDDVSLTVCELQDGQYAEVAHVAGTESVEVRSPSVVTVTPADLFD